MTEEDKSPKQMRNRVKFMRKELKYYVNRDSLGIRSKSCLELRNQDIDVEFENEDEAFGAYKMLSFLIKEERCLFDLDRGWY